MRFHGNATLYLAMGLCLGFMIPVLGCHVNNIFGVENGTPKLQPKDVEVFQEVTHVLKR
jgi:hypothetical protein